MSVAVICATAAFEIKPSLLPINGRKRIRGSSFSLWGHYVEAWVKLKGTKVNINGTGHTAVSRRWWTSLPLIPASPSYLSTRQTDGSNKGLRLLPLHLPARRDLRMWGRGWPIALLPGRSSFDKTDGRARQQLTHSKVILPPQHGQQALVNRPIGGGTRFHLHHDVSSSVKILLEPSRVNDPDIHSPKCELNVHIIIIISYMVTFPQTVFVFSSRLAELEKEMKRGTSGWMRAAAYWFAADWFAVHVAGGWRQRIPVSSFVVGDDSRHFAVDFLVGQKNPFDSTHLENKLELLQQLLFYGIVLVYQFNLCLQRVIMLPFHYSGHITN